MLLGKRPRPPMRRTASMTGITLDSGPQEPSDVSTLVEHVAAPPHDDHRNYIAAAAMDSSMNRSHGYEHNYLAATAVVSPRMNPYGIVEHMETAGFLQVCGLCQRSLVPSRDIYMYRGDTAFCSQECREQQMKKDERKEKRTSAAVSASVSK